MSQLLPDGMRDPVSGSVVVAADQSIQYGETWSFHVGGLCACDKNYPHLEVVSGRVLRARGLSTLAQWIRMTLITERFRYPIYSDSYGVEFDSLIRRSPTAEEAETEVPRMIREALQQDRRVAEVREVNLEAAAGDSASFLAEMEVVAFTGVVEDIAVALALEI